MSLPLQLGIRNGCNVHGNIIIQCDYFVSEHEEDLVDVLQDDDLSQEEMEEELCTEITGQGVLRCLVSSIPTLFFFLQVIAMKEDILNYRVASLLVCVSSIIIKLKIISQLYFAHAQDVLHKICPTPHPTRHTHVIS